MRPTFTTQYSVPSTQFTGTQNLAPTTQHPSSVWHLISSDQHASHVLLSIHLGRHVCVFIAACATPCLGSFSQSHCSV